MSAGSALGSPDSASASAAAALRRMTCLSGSVSRIRMRTSAIFGSLKSPSARVQAMRTWFAGLSLGSGLLRRVDERRHHRRIAGAAERVAGDDARRRSSAPPPGRSCRRRPGGRAGPSRPVRLAGLRVLGAGDVDDDAEDVGRLVLLLPGLAERLDRATGRPCARGGGAPRSARCRSPSLSTQVCGSFGSFSQATQKGRYRRQSLRSLMAPAYRFFLVMANITSVYSAA